MVEVKYVADSGEKFLFSTQTGVASVFDGLSGTSVDMGLAQGFAQVGQTVKNMSVSGGNIPVNGKIFKNEDYCRNTMRRLFATFQSGTLVFQDKYFIRVFVKDSPAFSNEKKWITFSMRFFSPYPFWQEISPSTFYIGAIIPAFHFPVNYAKPHFFGKTAPDRFVDVYNAGDVDAPFDVVAIAKVHIDGFTLTNMRTFEILKINGAIEQGQSVHIYRDAENQLHCDLITEGVAENVISWIDDESNLDVLRVGGNIIQAQDAAGGTNVEVYITFHQSLGGVYET